MPRSTNRFEKHKPITKPEVRVDYIHDRQVIIAPNRGQRPHEQPAATTVPTGIVVDHFSPESIQREHGRGILTVGGRKNWRIKVIRNIFPVVSPEFPKAYGHQEVVIETPTYGLELAQLSEERFDELLRVYAKRVRALQLDRRIRYILVFKNHGGRAGASINHAHSQIFASEYVPPHILVRRERAQEYRITHGSDYYSDLLLKEKNGPRWIHSGKYVCVLTPYASLYNYEAWIMPWRRVDNLGQMRPKEIRETARVLRLILRRLFDEGLPYNFYLHQVVSDQSEHLYLRISPRRDVWAGLELGSRLVVNSVPPEEAAQFYRPAFSR